MARLSPWGLIAGLAYAAVFIKPAVDAAPLLQPVVEQRDMFFGAAGEGTPPDAHPYGKKILYVDVQANRPLMSEVYDKNGEFWRFHHFQQQPITGEDGYKAILPVQGQQIDFKRQHSTNFASTYVINRKGAKESNFYLGKLEAAGK